ncbi:MAG: o-succinylbenzoate synthase [Bacteroidota bacterium]
MRLATADLIPYSLPLDPPITLAGEEVSERQGVLLKLGAESGEAGWGDCAPLPGFSRETLAEATSTLRTLAESLGEHSLDPRLFVDPTGPVARALDAAAPPPSVRYALDLALFNLGADVHGRSLAQALHPDPAVALPVAGLLQGDRKTVLEEARRMGRASYRAAKLKVGRGDLKDEIRLVRDVRKALGAGVELRLDANRAWTVEDATAFAEGIRGVGVRFVEEPLQDPTGLPALWMDTGLPIALDETVQLPEGQAFIRGWVAAVILKPTLVGGIGRTLQLAALARTVGARPILSSAYESGVGLRGLVALAAATDAEPAGLDTARAMKSDVLAERLPLEGPFVDVPALLARPIHLAEGVAA